ncbi:MAG: M23 family metallopeptidase [Nodosilinea sp.]
MLNPNNISIAQKQGFQLQQRHRCINTVALLPLLTFTTGFYLSTDNLALAQVDNPQGGQAPSQDPATYLLPTNLSGYSSPLRSRLNDPSPSLFKPHSIRFSPSRLLPDSPSSPPFPAALMQPPALPPTTALVAPAPTRATPDSLVHSVNASPGGEAPGQLSLPKGYNSVFVDPTDYQVGATPAPGTSPNVVFADRSGACQINISAQGGPSACHTPGQVQARRPLSQVSRKSSSGLQIGPINISEQGLSLGNTLVISREQLNARLNPLNLLRRGQEAYLFPLSIPASISSLFGWRLHPLEHDWRFHSGTDLAAPIGTPVLATQAGRVAVADFVGGYGLMVILRHGDSHLESRYAHLSQLAVRPGEWVEQGEVIGLVGSTGNSTGPHLHFEMRQLTNQGWVAMDPMEVLQYGLANLIKVINNPMVALAGATPPAPERAPTPEPAELPFRPAQPNAS